MVAVPSRGPRAAVRPTPPEPRTARPPSVWDRAREQLDGLPGPVAQVSQTTGIVVTEDDYDQFDTLSRAVDFLVRAGGTSAGPAPHQEVEP